MFSPYYAWARRRAGAAGADPLNHCAINVSLYQDGAKRWTMTERSRAQLQRSASQLQIGPSSLRWEHDRLLLQLDERTVPWPGALRGQVRLYPAGLHGRSHALDAAGLHRWWPIAPCARVEVELQSPALRWQGRAYLDSNRGCQALEDAFSDWHWSRAALPGGRCAVQYDARRTDGSRSALALHFDADGRCADLQPPPAATLPASAWRVPRATRCDSTAVATVRRTLEDGPFYVRSLVDSRWHDEPVQAVHESLSLDRFVRPWVQAMLPFRMPRRPV